MTAASWLPGVVVAIGVAAAGAAVGRARRTNASTRVVEQLAHGRRPRRHSLLIAWREPPPSLVEALREVEAPTRAHDLWRWWRAAAVSGILLGMAAAGPVLALIAGAAVLGAPVGVLAFLRGRQAAAYDAMLASALDATARGLRSGGSLAASIGQATSAVHGAVALDIQRVATAVDRGQPLGAALEAWARRRDRASVRVSVGALVLAAETGGPPARVIEEVAGALRVQLQVEGEARALAAQARLSAVVVGVAPIAFVALSSAVDAGNAHMLFGTPVGVAFLITGLALDGVGAVWMHRISESVVR